MSKVSLSMRLALVALVCFAGLTAAQANFIGCPGAPNPLNVTGDCPQLFSCQEQRCSCANGTWVNQTKACTINSTRTCANAAVCQLRYIGCLQAAMSAACLANYRLAVIAVISGSPYANSSVQVACRAETCRFYNESMVTGCATRDEAYAAVCVTPTNPPTPTPTTATPGTPRPSLAPGVAKYIATLRLSGNFTALLANPTARAALAAAVKADLERLLGYPVNIDELLDGSLIVKFTVDGASNDPALVAGIATAAAGASWLTSTQTAYTANGGVGTLTVLGITPTTPAPPTPVPTTKAPASAGAMSATLAALVAATMLLLA